MAAKCNSGADKLLGGLDMRFPLACLPAFMLCCAAAQAQQKPAPPKPGPSTAQQAPASNLPVVRLIATGGTIAMKIDPVKKAPVPAISGEDLIATVREIQKVARIEVQNLANVPSDYMDPDRWIQLQKAVAESLARPE